MVLREAGLGIALSIPVKAPLRNYWIQYICNYSLKIYYLNMKRFEDSYNNFIVTSQLSIWTGKYTYHHFCTQYLKILRWSNVDLA